MNKAELIASVAQKNALTRKDAEKLVSSVLETITQTLSAGEKVSLWALAPLRSRPARRMRASTP